MAQFDVFLNPVPAARDAYPFVIALQSDLAADPDQVVTAPLARAARAARTTARLTPRVLLDEEAYIVWVAALATFARGDLRSRVANLAGDRGALLGAVDILFYGV